MKSQSWDYLAEVTCMSWKSTQKSRRDKSERMLFQLHPVAGFTLSSLILDSLTHSLHWVQRWSSGKQHDNGNDGMKKEQELTTKGSKEHTVREI